MRDGRTRLRKMRATENRGWAANPEGTRKLLCWTKVRGSLSVYQDSVIARGSVRTLVYSVWNEKCCGEARWWIPAALLDEGLVASIFSLGA
jgi:hypothetical protein